jgi:hypothetical protein
MSRTPDTGTHEQTLVQASALLDVWSRRDWTDGLQLESLPALHSLQIHTRNTEYRVIIIDGRRGDVLVTGGRFFPTPTRARLNGSTLGGSLLKWRGVYCGFRLELQLGTQIIVTTRVREVTVATGADAPGEPVH